MGGGIVVVLIVVEVTFSQLFCLMNQFDQCVHVAQSLGSSFR